MAQAEPRHYRLDPAHSFVHFEVLHFGTSTLRGRFGPLDGDVQIDPQAGTGYVGLTIPVAAVDTGMKVLDRRLCERDLLACADHPDAYFVAERFAFAGEAVRELRGELTLRGVSQPLTLKATRFHCYPHPMLKREVCGGDFEAELLRSDFGARFGVAFVSDRVRLKIQVEGIRR
ncbi:MAG: YceI family protein [Pseudomonadota bacterium]